MPAWLQEFLTGMDMAVAAGIWNSTMKAVGGMLLKRPQAFSSGAWSFVEGTVYPFTLSVGLSLLNLFFIIGWLQALSRLHENITLELVVNELIRFVTANALFLNLKPLMTGLFSAAGAIAGKAFTLKAPVLKANDLDVGSVLFYNLFGILYIMAAIVCSFLILITIYSRYIRLYLLVAAAPFAVSTIIGGDEARRTFISWLKTFILNAFEVVMIAMVMVICFKLTEAGIDVFEKGNKAVEAVNGFWDALNGLFTMVLMTASVKGMNSFMARTFGL